MIDKVQKPTNSEFYTPLESKKDRYDVQEDWDCGLYEDIS
jgi:hypothetical protein